MGAHLVARCLFSAAPVRHFDAPSGSQKMLNCAEGAPLSLRNNTQHPFTAARQPCENSCSYRATRQLLPRSQREKGNPSSARPHFSV